ncbi:MAG: putative metal-binding motif-containing protein [Kofleriaceae bacterium]|nr:putative metal-binding motif-containing protein [Kofleriaceae bacterium]
MSQPVLLTCAACDGLIPAPRATCPHCDAAVVRPRGGALRRVLATLAGGGAFVTLMACYGVGPRYGDRPYGPEACVDADHDGVCAPQDCDDTNPMIVPGGEDVDGDGVDQNCDGVDGWRDPATVAAPADGDAPPVEPTPVATDPDAPPPDAPPPTGVATDPPAPAPTP